MPFTSHLSGQHRAGFGGQKPRKNFLSLAVPDDLAVRQHDDTVGDVQDALDGK